MADSTETIIDVPQDTVLTKLLFGDLGDTIDLANPVEIEAAVTSFLLLFFIVFLLAAIVYKLGFAKKLPILKSLIIYVILFIGCIPLTYLAVGLPVAEGLFIAAIVLLIYKIRLKQSQKGQQKGTVS